MTSEFFNEFLSLSEAQLFGLVLALWVGVILGTAFFGGLWWTVQKIVVANRSALWLLCGMVARSGITVMGFYWVADGEWQRLIACLIGFVFARFIVDRLVASLETKVLGRSIGEHEPAEEVKHAS